MLRGESREYRVRHKDIVVVVGLESAAVRGSSRTRATDGVDRYHYSSSVAGLTGGKAHGLQESRLTARRVI